MAAARATPSSARSRPRRRLASAAAICSWFSAAAHISAVCSCHASAALALAPSASSFSDRREAARARRRHQRGLAFARGARWGRPRPSPAPRSGWRCRCGRPAPAASRRSASPRWRGRRRRAAAAPSPRRRRPRRGAAPSDPSTCVAFTSAFFAISARTAWRSPARTASNSVSAPAAAGPRTSPAATAMASQAHGHSLRQMSSGRSLAPNVSIGAPAFCASASSRLAIGSARVGFVLPERLHRAGAAAEDHRRQRVVRVVVGVAHAAAEEHHRMVEQRAFAVGRRPQLLDELREHRYEVRVHLGEVDRLGGIVAAPVGFVRERVMRIRDADVRERPPGDVAHHHEREDSRDVRPAGPPPSGRTAAPRARRTPQAGPPAPRTRSDCGWPGPRRS